MLDNTILNIMQEDDLLLEKHKMKQLKYYKRLTELLESSIANLTDDIATESDKDKLLKKSGSLLALKEILKLLKS